MSINKAYEDRIRERMFPQKYILECFLEDLQVRINSSEFDQINYTVSSRTLQEAFKKKSFKILKPTVFGRTIAVFLDMNDLEENKDFTRICGGGSNKYHIEIKKERAKELLSYLIPDETISI